MSVYQGIKYTRKLVATIAATIMIVTKIPFFVVRFFFSSFSEPANFHQAKIKLVIGRQSLIFLLFEFDRVGAVKKWNGENFLNLQIVNTPIDKFRNLSINSCSFYFILFPTTLT